MDSMVFFLSIENFAYLFENLKVETFDDLFSLKHDLNLVNFKYNF